jgi:hypothetical protein
MVGIFNHGGHGGHGVEEEEVGAVFCLSVSFVGGISGQGERFINNIE